jgi:Polyketide cyclase / dehydrase and lipid transport
MFGRLAHPASPPISAGKEPDARTWRSDIAVRAAPEHVLDTLTDIDACEVWSPVGFRIDELDSCRLRTGTTATVSGALAGRRVRFRLEIRRADSECLMLRAAGPVQILAHYRVRPADQGSRVDAEISVWPTPGRSGALAARATFVLLASGALRHALQRMGHEAERRHPLAWSERPRREHLTAGAR